jgi:hypothetical protein
MNKKIWNKQVEEIFRQETPEDYQIYLNIINLALYNKDNSDLSNLYKSIGLEKFGEVINRFSGKTITFPNKNEFKELLILSTCYYLKEIKKLSWDEIKLEVPYQDISSIKYGKQISKLTAKVQEELKNIFQSTEGYIHE